MGEREVRERYARMETRADVVDRLVDEAKPTRMIGAAAVGGTPTWFTLLLVPLFGPVDISDPSESTVSAPANVTSRTVLTSTTAALREPRQTSGVALLCGHALSA